MANGNRRHFLGHLASGLAAFAGAPGAWAERSNSVNDDQDRRAAQRAGGAVSLFLCGDLMTGRAIDQVLPYSNDPILYEPFVGSAAEYVTLAEAVSGPIPRPLDFAALWGDALEALARMAPDVRIVNLETAVTTSDDAAPKGINYRMHPGNVPILTVAGVDCAVLANNHVLDWGQKGLLETLATLEKAGVAIAGAGRDAAAARAPAVLGSGGKRVRVYAVGHRSSGIPGHWAAGAGEPGVALLEDLSAAGARELAARIGHERRAGDIVVVSIHWGGNWGYAVPPDQQAFAHHLIDGAGVDVVHGHSSHHVKAIEVYRDRLILYGCGDFLNDYEGISGHARYRPRLGLMYFPRMDPGTGRLLELAMIPTRIDGLRIRYASDDEARWLAELLSREGRPFGTTVDRDEDNTLRLRWG